MGIRMFLFLLVQSGKLFWCTDLNCVEICWPQIEINKILYITRKFRLVKFKRSNTKIKIK